MPCHLGHGFSSSTLQLLFAMLAPGMYRHCNISYSTALLCNKCGRTSLPSFRFHMLCSRFLMFSLRGLLVHLHSWDTHMGTVCKWATQLHSTHCGSPLYRPVTIQFPVRVLPFPLHFVSPS